MRRSNEAIKSESDSSEVMSDHLGNPRQPAIDEPVVAQKTKKITVTALIVTALLLLGVIGFFVCQYIVFTNRPLNNLSAQQDKTFKYGNFAIGCPDSWILLDMSVDDNFPLKDRFYPLYSSDKVIAFEKNDIYLIITIESESGGGAEGIFVNDIQYNEFVSSKDVFVIGETTFYLSKRHYEINQLAESHAGPYGWSVLSEYVPNMSTQSGETFVGYKNVIKRNGFSYNFVVAGDQGGVTDRQLQKEIIEILGSIEW